MYAFGLPEAIVRVEVSFVFKGRLFFLLDHAMRLSTDIDIVNGIKHFERGDNGPLEGKN